jgi:vitamin B12 transporter
MAVRAQYFLVSISMKKMIRTRALALPALSVLSMAVAASVQAQEIEVNPVVVSASRMEQPLSQVLPSVSVITRSDIEKSQAATLADLLQGEAGVEFSRTGGPGSTTSFFLRGQNSVNTVILIDGVRTQVDGGGSLTVTDFPLSMVERIEILRGNASALYGEAAIGGVINITTRHTRGSPKANYSATLGSYGTRSVTAGYGGEVEDYSFDFNAGKTAVDGFSAINPSTYSSANPDANGSQATFAGMRVEKKLTRDRVVSLRTNIKRQDTSYDSASDLSTDVHAFQNQTDAFGVAWKESFTPDWQSTVDVSNSNFAYDSLKNGRIASSSGTPNGQYMGHQDNFRWLNTYQLQDKTLATFGLEQSDERYKQLNTYQAKRELSSRFMGVTHQVNAWTWQLNARYDQAAVSQDASSRVANSSTSYLAGVGYALTPAWQMTSSISTGVRTPNASELFGYGGTATLTPEKHQSQEVGLTFQQEKTLGRFVYFNTASQNAIIWSESDLCASNCYKNVSKTNNRGIEASLRTVAAGYSIKLSAVVQDPWNEADGTSLTRRAKRYGAIDVSRAVLGYELGSKIYSSSSRSDFDYEAYPAEPVSLSGYTLWAFYASRKIDNEWTARVKLENAFNRDYQLAYGYNTPGRGIYATLQYQPK